MTSPLKLTPPQRIVLSMLRLDGARLVHHDPRGTGRGSYTVLVPGLNGLGQWHQARTIRPLLDAGLISQDQIDRSGGPAEAGR